MNGVVEFAGRLKPVFQAPTQCPEAHAAVIRCGAVLVSVVLETREQGVGGTVNHATGNMSKFGQKKARIARA
ncbi:hypothetical protein [Massilia sp. ZL223]|uniref:hypothetical protein n=1 Tax=Massilia sp. ZL223 TaxID=2824904 RepID=UPI001B81B56D|nr:hypothetical protein [Massilia sp. ZL223]MBQ5964970.1 hypothetical protein [Massilia sp. ZL223]